MTRPIDSRMLRDGPIHISQVDPKMRRAIRLVGPCGLPKRRGRYAALVRSIVGQQVSTKAAQAVYERLRQAAGGWVTPERVSSLDDQALRALGLSRQKMRYVRCLTETVVSGELKLEQLHRFDDEKVIEALTCVTGLGRWSAEMFLMFVLARPDVLPLGDLGIRKGFVRAYGLRNLPSERRMTDLASSWRPYRTIGCFYLWRILDLAPA